MFGWMAAQVRDLADALCGGRYVTILEGGYEPEAVAECTQAHVQALAASRP